MITELLKQPGRLIGLIIVVADIALIALIMLRKIPTESREMALLAIGGLSAKSMSVVSFYYGASDVRDSGGNSEN